MASTFAGGTLRVTTPSSYDAKPASRKRDLPGGPEGSREAGKDALVAALEDAGLDPVERVDLTPRKAKDLEEKPGANRAEKVQLEVDVPPGEDAVVLLEHDGVYSWHLPVNAAERTKSLDQTPRTARFELVVQPRPTRRRTASPASGERRTKGLLGDLVQGAAQALVFRFVAPAILEKAIDAMEDHVRPGIVHLAGADVKKWRELETLDELDLPTDRPVRLLLLVHGTFSSTVGAFGALGIEENGRGFLRTAISAYDAVIGFDHKTLSLDPRQNAEDLLTRLETHHPKAELVIDVITHSRGGLVTRSLVEHLLPAADWPATVDNVVFVASTNAGTRLADPKRWSDLVDIYTNLAAVGASGLSLLPGAAPVAAVVGGLVKGIGAFVKYLVSYAAEGDVVPGLKAMVPGGAFVKEINKTQKGQPGPGTNWYVVSSNFHVELFDNDHNPKEFPRELVVKLGEGFVDKLFKGPNDLVVDVSSMDAIDAKVGGFVRDTLALGENETVYHTNYFSQLRVIEALAGWLPLGLGAGGGEEAAAQSAEPSAGAPPPAGPPAAGPPAAAPMPEPPAGAPMPEPPTGAGRAEPPRQRSPKPPKDNAAEATELTRASLAAEMPAHVVAKKEFAVRVRLSRNAIEATAGTAHEERDIEVDAERPLTAQVIGKSNAEVVGTDTDKFDLPSGGGTSELQFQLRAKAPGPVKVMVVVRQGTVLNTTITLTATAGSKAEGATKPAEDTVTTEVHSGIDAPELEGLPCLDIVEREEGKGAVVFQYALRLLKGEPAVKFESAVIKDRQRQIGKILDDVAAIWKNTEADPREREQKLQDVGSKLFDELFPVPMQAYLWKHRSKLKDLIVYADEPFVPWELVHLKPPEGPRPTKPHFLAQNGLVRWHLNSFPPRQIRVRDGHAKSLCPEYRDPQYTLTEPVYERQFLEERFGASPVPATPTGVRTLLRSGGYDLLHFSGHGAANSGKILDAKLLLQGRKRGGTVEPQYFGATTVSENAKHAATNGIGPVVVLNACQVGQAGELLTTVGGFAKAFLDAGASAFVSCLWSVHQEPSRTFVEKLYEELLDGTPMATASARAREATRKAGDATWLAFVVYSRPDAVLVRS